MSWKKTVSDIFSAGSLILQVSITLVLLIVTGFFAALTYNTLMEPSDAWMAYFCFGPPLLVVGIAFLITLVWTLSALGKKFYQMEKEERREVQIEKKKQKRKKKK